MRNTLKEEKEETIEGKNARLIIGKKVNQKGKKPLLGKMRLMKGKEKELITGKEN